MGEAAAAERAPPPEGEETPREPVGSSMIEMKRRNDARRENRDVTRWKGSRTKDVLLEPRTFYQKSHKFVRFLPFFSEID
jgi:hypothetical protein